MLRGFGPSDQGFKDSDTSQEAVLVVQRDSGLRPKVGQYEWREAEVRAFLRWNEKGSQVTEAVCEKSGAEEKGESKDKNGSKCPSVGDWVADRCHS